MRFSEFAVKCLSFSSIRLQCPLPAKANSCTYFDISTHQVIAESLRDSCVYLSLTLFRYESRNSYVHTLWHWRWHTHTNAFTVKTFMDIVLTYHCQPLQRYGSRFIMSVGGRQPFIVQSETNGIYFTLTFGLRAKIRNKSAWPVENSSLDNASESFNTHRCSSGIIIIAAITRQLQVVLHAYRKHVNHKSNFFFEIFPHWTI